MVETNQSSAVGSKLEEEAKKVGMMNRQFSIDDMNFERDDLVLEKGSSSSSFNSNSSRNRRGGQTTSRSNNNSNNNNKRKHASSPSLIRDDPWVKRLRLVVLLVLLMSGVICCAVVLLSLRDSETQEFENRWDHQWAHIGHALHAEVNSKLNAIDSLAITVQSYAGSRPIGWPQITLPEFPYRAFSAKNIGGGLSIALHPLVTNATRLDWETYAMEKNDEWRLEGLVFQTQFPEVLSSGGNDGGGGHRHHGGGDSHHLRRERRSLQVVDGSPNEGNSSAMDMDMMDGEHSAMDSQHGEHASGMDMSDGGHHDSTNTHMNNNHSSTSLMIDDIVDYQPIEDHIWELKNGHILPRSGAEEEDDNIMFLPLWQHVPVYTGQPWVNFDILSDSERNSQVVDAVLKSEQAVIAKYFLLEDSNKGRNFPELHGHDERRISEEAPGDQHHNKDHAEQTMDDKNINNLDGPASTIWYPIFDDFDQTRTVVAVLGMTVKWDSFFLASLPPDPEGIHVVISNPCDQIFTFEITGPEVIFLGEGDHHEDEYDDYKKIFGIENPGSSFTGIPLSMDSCPYTVEVYPSMQMEAPFHTNKPMMYTIGIGSIFVFAVLIFTFYDFLVERRQRNVSQTAKRSSAIVSALFPEVVRDRLYEESNNNNNNNNNKNTSGDSAHHSSALGSSNNMMLGNVTGTDQRGAMKENSPPIADLFPKCTVMFGDIAGFTAWSSSREPSQVFILLEALYGKFDEIANKMSVFKVETIGDCYVAVTGLPRPMKDHHVRMVRFARACLLSMGQVTSDLEVSLGPDTNDLGFRVGLHSGPVTAGVLRGEKSRFQLFGDTVNMASRMESTGKVNRIQISEATAELMRLAGKSHWTKKREELVSAKGKGELQTYWVQHGTSTHSTMDESLHSASIHRDDTATERSVASSFFLEEWGETKVKGGDEPDQRLIDWQVAILSKLLQTIVAKRQNCHSTEANMSTTLPTKPGGPRGEIAEVISISADACDGTEHPKQRKDPTVDDLDPEVKKQLQDMVLTLSTLYQNNPFHNWNHACHVTMSAMKLMSRVVKAPTTLEGTATADEKLQKYTYGLTSDPLTQFAIAFSAMIHDLDHRGVTNGQLAKEETQLATLYDNKSVAEQNSIDVAWEVFTSPTNKDLVSCICGDDEAEFLRFRQLVVNCIMATDIFDKDLLRFRNERWDKAFHQEESDGNDEGTTTNSDRKATIVIEHILQAADVAHTMQHWHVYTKWNEKLFEEVYAAYKSGRGPGKDPSETWYEGELWFFDNYVIPLGKKLEECGAFGVSSAECLNYALENRKEWELKGKSIVDDMVSRYQ